MTMMGTRPSSLWRELCRQSEISDEQLEANIPASEICPGAYWIHQEIKKPEPDETLKFLTIWGPSVWIITGTIYDLYERERSVFRGRQIGVISMWLQKYQIEKIETEDGIVTSISVGSIQPIKAEPRKEVVSVYPVIPGPLLSSVRWFKGKGSVISRYSVDGKEYQIMSHPHSPEHVEVPQQVKIAWQSTYYKRTEGIVTGKHQIGRAHV